MKDSLKERTAQKMAAKLPVLSALCLFLSTIEYMIPKPLPFIRLGLANAPLLLALRMPPSSFFLLVFVKILGQAFISGTLFSYVFLLSLSGTTLSAAAMYFLRRIAPEKYMSLLGISVTGAVISSITQIALARLFILGPGAVYIMPPFLAMSIISGTALGAFCERFAAKSRWYRDGPVEASAAAPILPEKQPACSGAYGGGKKPLLDTNKIPPAPLFFAGLFMAAALLFTKGVMVRSVLFFAFLLLALLAGKTGNIFLTFVFFVVIVLFNALIPYGRVLFEIGAFSLTEGALTQGIEKAATVEGLVMLSRFTISPRLRLPGRAGALLTESFLLLPQLYEKKAAIHTKTFIDDIDKALLELNAK
ncbi:MAG: Gx transporter family protein [Spirochaetaceae bacterium]|jgi:heptaprenyl diphosphate synthase|nr:Gx transporter family protein [Spirochaetaceae bacterium]